MFTVELYARSWRAVMVERLSQPPRGGLGCFPGGPRTLGHITGYSTLSQSGRVLSLFQAARVQDAAETPEPISSQRRQGSAFGRTVNSA